MTTSTRMPCLLFLTAVILTGCATFRDPSIGYIPQWNTRVAGLTTNDIPLPAITPFDSTNALRQAYLGGYSDGIGYAKKVLDYGSLGVVVAATTDKVQAHFQGWKDGHYAASLKIDQVRRTVEAETIAAYSNRNMEASFYPSGRLASLEEYAVAADGERHETCYTEWYDTGQMAEYVHCDRNGDPHGTRKLYYENGQAREIQHFVHGSLQGDWKVYHENGHLAYRISYVDDIPFGTVTRSKCLGGFLGFRAQKPCTNRAQEAGDDTGFQRVARRPRAGHNLQ